MADGLFSVGHIRSTFAAREGHPLSIWEVDGEVDTLATIPILAVWIRQVRIQLEQAYDLPTPISRGVVCRRRSPAGPSLPISKSHCLSRGHPRDSDPSLEPDGHQPT